MDDLDEIGNIVTVLCGWIDMDSLSIRKEMSLAYVASCVTLTCTLATVIDLAAITNAQNISLYSSETPYSWLSQLRQKLPQSHHLLLTSRFRAERLKNRLAIGGLYV